ncbi:hypothetical protein [Oscillatoria salina]|uniref:hypothetical protein n=1 Tax=Oscillatoria salina TaxID=331517 RepID=UPI0013B9EACE|nr:hypothetical protein [Oscillatoria salina]MBZ8182300.1 hypothetical protein [Oscillatoria salina IIICB1]NET91640.1 hypothetical protein [Kamptonema sp. SIO1D9]
MADLTGTWLGTYWQLGMPTRFELSIVQGGNTITGNILDDSYLGEASLSGSVVGRNVSFVKRYLTSARHSINYTGTISEDENFIHGKWQIDKRHSGKWEARRSGENLTVEIETSKANQLPVLSKS